MILTPAVGVKVTQTAGVGAAQTISRDTRPGLWGRSKAGDTQGLEVGESPAMRNSAPQGHCGGVCVCLAVPMPWQEMAFQQLWPAGWGFFYFFSLVH